MITSEEINAYDKKVAYAGSDYFSGSGFVSGGIFYEIRFNSSGHIMLRERTPSSIDRIGKITGSSKLEQSVLDAFLSGSKTVTVNLPISVDE